MTFKFKFKETQRDRKQSIYFIKFVSKAQGNYG